MLLFNLGIPRLSRRLGDRLCLEGAWNPDVARPVPWAIAAFLLVRRSAFEQVGRFDPAMWLHAEDLDLAWRMKEAGWKTWYEPSAHVHHAGSVSTRKAFGAGVQERFMTESYRWMARRRGLRVARAVALINLVGSGARALVLTPLARVMPGRFRAAQRSLAHWARVHARGLRSLR
jgi:GT2 family glycosyltransferase